MMTKYDKILRNKNILVTGGTGSFGSKFVDALLKTKANSILILSRDEKKQEDMRIAIHDKRVKFVLGDVRDYNSINNSFYNIDYVFHAAALKQVPSCEFFPMEAVKTNILGAENVMNAAFNNKVKKCILLSTDKAVYPINTMGLTKAVMERVMLSKARENINSQTIFSATRYGNVIGSRGSVIPLFLDQISKNIPITITNPEMTRFLMSLQDAVELVFYALMNASQGDIFVQKAPAARLEDLVFAMEKLFNRSLERNIIGTRHGEKLYEDLVSYEELLRSDETDFFYRIKMDSRNLKYESFLVDGYLHKDKQESYNSHNTTRLSPEEITSLLKKANIKNG